MIESSDAIVIVTDHSAIGYEMILRHAKLVVDTRNATARRRQPNHSGPDGIVAASAAPIRAGVRIA